MYYDNIALNKVFAILKCIKIISKFYLFYNFHVFNLFRNAWGFFIFKYIFKN